MVVLPPALNQEIVLALGLGEGTLLKGEPLSGGSISKALRLETAHGPVFLKWHRDGDRHFFQHEANGLNALREGIVSANAGLIVPEVLAMGTGPADPWIALSWIAPGPATPASHIALGEGLAHLHRAQADRTARDPEPWGWSADNVIGSLDQPNTPSEDWCTFWSHRRVREMADRAHSSGRLRHGDREVILQAVERFPDLLESVASADGPSLLHGDLWGGNVLHTQDGVPAIIDPAVYYGHREVDLAMTELFGGFRPEFYTAYDGVWPLQAGYREVRRSAYQLYPLLVHAVLFGGDYGTSAAAAAHRILAC